MQHFWQQTIQNIVQHPIYQQAAQMLKDMLKSDVFMSNAFNFILLVIIIAIIYKKCKVGAMINAGIEGIKKNIDNSILAKNN